MKKLWAFEWSFGICPSLGIRPLIRQLIYMQLQYLQTAFLRMLTVHLHYRLQPQRYWYQWRYLVPYVDVGQTLLHMARYLGNSSPAFLAPLGTKVTRTLKSARLHWIRAGWLNMSLLSVGRGGWGPFCIGSLARAPSTPCLADSLGFSRKCELAAQTTLSDPRTSVDQ